MITLAPVKERAAALRSGQTGLHAWQATSSGRSFLPAFLLRLLLAGVFLPGLLPLHAQDVINIDGRACGLHGTAKYGSETYVLNEYKNRYHFPGKNDIDKSVTLALLTHTGDPNRLSPQKAAVLQGYVFDVKVGGVETCNCRTKDPRYRDTHIEIVPDESKTGPENRLIVEVTPRLRALMEAKGVDWSTEGIRKMYKGRRVEVTGWLTYDGEHESAAFANDPSDAIGERNWRATCWEVHPVTAMKLLSNSRSVKPVAKSESPDRAVVRKEQETNQQAASTNTGLRIALVVAVLLIIYLLVRKKRR